MGGATLDNDVVMRYTNMVNGTPHIERVRICKIKGRNSGGWLAWHNTVSDWTRASACAVADQLRDTNNGNLNSTRVWLR